MDMTAGRGGALVASLLTNAVVAMGLLMLGHRTSNAQVEPRRLTVMSLAAPKGNDQSEESRSTRAEVRVTAAAEPVAVSASPHLRPSPPSLSILSNISPQTLAVVPPSVAVAAPAATGAAAAPSAPAELHAGSAAPALAKRGRTDGIDAPATANASDYAAKIRTWLYAHKVYPRRARLHRQEGVVRVRFAIDRGGGLLDGSILSSSGIPALDEEARAMLKRAAPYPKAPPAVAGSRLEFSVPIDFSLSS